MGSPVPVPRRRREGLDAVVVGAGPNGLAAAVVLARAGLGVRVLEAAAAVGGGARTEELTLPGFLHDTCSAVHPLGVGSPLFRTWPLADFGLEWVHPAVPVAHPLEGGAAVLHRSPALTASGLGADGRAWERLFAPFARRWDDLAEDLLAPPLRWPRHGLLAARFGLLGLRSAAGLAGRRFRGEPARALFAGLAAHSAVPLERAGTAGFGLVLGVLGHAVGWPFPKGGAGALSAALAGYLESLGGEIVTGVRVRSLAELPPARAVILDLVPRGVLEVAGARLSRRHAAALRRYRHGPGAFKLDWALSGPIPWSDPACEGAGTLHLGGTLAEVAEAERAPWAGRVAERPFVLLAQPSRFDPTRAPSGRHVGWAYAHVPPWWEGDATARIEAQVERFAPGFQDRILARHVLGPAELERRNPNLVGGDVGGGANTVCGLLARPRLALRPHVLPLPDTYLCSAATPPGGGVHGMGGWHAARAALRWTFGRRTEDLTGRE